MFTLHDIEDAPEASKPYLKNTLNSFGMIPNLEKTMAALPELLAVYSFAWDKFYSVALTPVEQQVVYQTVNFENECNYCVPWHTMLSKQAGMTDEDSTALRNGATLPSPKLNALSVFARRLVVNRGKVTKAQLSEFFDAGYDEKAALSVVLGIAIKTMSNFTNSIAGTPLDNEVCHLAWTKSVIALRN